MNRMDFSIPKGILVAGVVSLAVLCWIGISQGQSGRTSQRGTSGNGEASPNRNVVIDFLSSSSTKLTTAGPTVFPEASIPSTSLALDSNETQTPQASSGGSQPVVSEGASAGVKWIRTRRPAERSLDWHSPAPTGYVRPQPPNVKKVAPMLGLQSLTLPPLGTGELLDVVVSAQYAQSAAVKTVADSIEVGASLQYPPRTAIPNSEGPSDPLSSEWLEKCFVEVSPSTPVGSTLKRRVLFIGHSHSRYLAAMLCLFLNGTTCSQFSLHRRPATVIQLNPLTPPTSPPTGFLAWIQANYDLRPRLRLYFRALVNGTNKEGGSAGFIPVQPLLARQLHQGIAGLQAGETEITDRDVGMERRSELDPKTNGSSVRPSIAGDLTHIVVSRGAWDLLFRDADPETIVGELVDGLMELRGRFPSAAIVLQLPHYVHSRLPARRPTQRGKLSSYQRSLWRATCFSPARVQLMRDVNLCAFHRLHKTNSASSAGSGSTSSMTCSNSTSSDRTGGSGVPSPPSWLEMFDVFAESKTPLADQYADALGHHYLDVMLEWMTKALVTRHLCRRQVPKLPCEVEAAFYRVGQRACEKVAAASRSFAPLEQCSCHNPTYASGAVCKGFGRHVPASTD
jgi:hypothetical protein